MHALLTRLRERRSVLRVRSDLLVQAAEDGEDVDTELTILLDELEALRDLYQVVELEQIRRRVMAAT